MPELSEEVVNTKIDPVTKNEIEHRGAATMHEIDEAIRMVLDEAPSDSAAELVLRRSSHGYKGLLTIYSRQRKFVGGSSSLRFTDVIKSIFSEVHEQIGEWKKIASYKPEANGQNCTDCGPAFVDPKAPIWPAFRVSFFTIR